MGKLKLPKYLKSRPQPGPQIISTPKIMPSFNGEEYSFFGGAGRFIVKLWGGKYSCDSHCKTLESVANWQLKSKRPNTLKL